MTLIITALADNVVIQVSDRRLTATNGKLYDDLAIKEICVSCADARFCMAYTGLAKIDCRRTDEWVFDFLSSINAGKLTFTKLFDSLHKQVSSTFRRLHYLGRVRGITFAIAGFCRTRAFMGLLSNVEDGKGNWLKDVDDNFQSHFYFRDTKPLRKLAVVINGAEDAIDDLGNTLEKIRKRYLGKNPVNIVAVLVQLIRMASEHREVGYTIGRNCLSTIVMPNCGFTCQDHPDEDSPQQHAPHCILQNQTYKSIKIWTGGSVPPWWT